MTLINQQYRYPLIYKVSVFSLSLLPFSLSLISLPSYGEITLTPVKQQLLQNQTIKALPKVLLKTGPYTIFSQKALTLLDTNTTVNLLASGFKWAEGPVWSQTGKCLLFSDIPNNKVLKYTQASGVTEYLTVSGQSNGLMIDHNDRLTLLQSVPRQVARMNAPLNQPLASYTPLATHVEQLKLNSPNDGVFADNGMLYFTDPPYGLAGQLNDPAKELSYQGVYRLDTNGSLTLLDKSILYPNGIAISTDQLSLYVAASDPDTPAWYHYTLTTDGNVKSKRTFYILPKITDKSIGLPDGLKIHPSGIIFATGPNGLWLFDVDGSLLAKVALPSVAANLAFDGQYSTVYITAHMNLLSLNIKPYSL